MPALDAAGQAAERAGSRRPSSQAIGSWASLPRRPATSKPSPISTPFTAWMLMSARASSGVELAVPVDVAAEPDRHAVGEHLDDAAERVAVLGRRLDLGDHRRRPPPGRSSAPRDSSTRSRSPGRGRSAAFDRTAPESGRRGRRSRSPSVAEQQLGQRAGGDPGRGLPGRGPLEDVAGVGEAVLLHAGQVGVTGPGLGERRGGRPVLGGRRHLLLPLVGVALPLGVGDLDGDRRAERAAVADAAEERDLVLLEAHPRPTAVAEPAPGQLGLRRRRPRPPGRRAGPRRRRRGRGRATRRR